MCVRFSQALFHSVLLWWHWGGPVAAIAGGIQPQGGGDQLLLFANCTDLYQWIPRKLLHHLPLLGWASHQNEHYYYSPCLLVYIIFQLHFCAVLYSLLLVGGKSQGTKQHSFSRCLWVQQRFVWAQQEVNTIGGPSKVCSWSVYPVDAHPEHLGFLSLGNQHAVGEIHLFSPTMQIIACSYFS